MKSTKSNIAVIIPCYKKELNPLEKISLKQGKKILYKYDIIFVIPQCMKNNCFEGEKSVCFENEFFESRESYNRLMLSEEFYLAFKEYKYILIYQLDAFVFSDKLADFCQLGYDYIGAPWIDGIPYYDDYNHFIWYVGNGGLSLRKVQSCIRLIREKRSFLENFLRNEDVFFAISSEAYYKVAPIDVALKFSFECDVRKCFSLNSDQLPFGCHAWEKYDFDFWRKYIEQQGHDLDGFRMEVGDIDCKELQKKKQNLERNKFLESKYTPELLKTVLDEILYENSVSAISIWGAGFWADNWIKMLLDSGYMINNIYDAKEELHNQKINGLVVKPLELLEKEVDTLILVSVIISKNDIEAEIRRLGLKHKIKYILGTDVINRMQLNYEKRK